MDEQITQSLAYSSLHAHEQALGSEWYIAHGIPIRHGPSW